LAEKIKELDSSDKKRIEYTDILLGKLYDMGIIPLKQSLEQCAKITVSSFCRRRLAVVLVRLKFAENLKEATTLIEQGHIRVGPQQVRDPALLVTRNMEDFITWTDHSKIKRKVLLYNDQLDDYDLL
jgi:U3 small nucleolar ribonucleoprotein protein IMP3